MNVISSALSGSGVALASLSASAKAQADEAKATRTSGWSSPSSQSSSPATDARKQLQAIQKGMVALMLISDPVERARAAARMYKQYANVAKQYAAATADGRAAAQAQSLANQQANAQASEGETPDGEDPNAASQDGQAASPQITLPQIAPPAAAPGFVKDDVMEEIKTFANAAKMVYDLAVQEARRKHADKSKLNGMDDDVKDSASILDQAAKDVEGDPDSVAAGYTPSGQATSPAASPAAFDLST